MGLAYGIQIARQTLGALATEKDLSDRLGHASLEIEAMDSSDVYDFNEIEKWKQDYQTLNSKEQQSAESISNLRNLSLTLVNLCADIIEQNAIHDTENTEEGGGD